MLPILQVPDSRLRQTSQPLMVIDKKVLDFIRQLENTLIHQGNPKGVGLSAIQVGKPWRIFLSYLPPTPNHEPTIQVFINPEIISASKTLTLGKQSQRPTTNDQKPTANNDQKPILEGCLSIPGIYGPVLRHQWVKLKYYKLQATSYKLSEKTQVFSDFPARVIQHELDHLNGILFTDRSLEQHLPLYQDKSDHLVPLSLSPQSTA